MLGFTSENTFPKPGMRLIENSKPYLLRCQHTLSATPDNTSVPREGCGKELLRGIGSELMSPRPCSRCWKESGKQDRQVPVLEEHWGKTDSTC